MISDGFGVLALSQTATWQFAPTLSQTATWQFAPDLSQTATWQFAPVCVPTSVLLSSPLLIIPRECIVLRSLPWVVTSA